MEHVDSLGTMFRRGWVLCLVLIMIDAVSCTKELSSRIDSLETRLAKLEKDVFQMNQTMTSLSRMIDALDSRDFLCGFELLVDDKGKQIGYALEFYKSGKLMVSNVSNAPELGLILMDDGRYYWSLGGELLKDVEGNPVLAAARDGKTPVLKIENGYWWVSYDGGSFFEKLTPYGGEDESGIRCVSETDKDVLFELWDGTTIAIPKEMALSIELEQDRVTLKRNTSKLIAYRIISSIEPVSMEVICSGNCQARIISKEGSTLSGFVDITLCGDSNAYSKVALIATNGRSTAIRTLVVEAELDEDEMQMVKVKGAQLYIGYRFNEKEDLLIVFGKCMYNKLMSFSQVGFAGNDGHLHPDPSRTIKELVNLASSDNIGPVLIGKKWVGGNHSISKSDGSETYTAESESFSFWADGVPLNDGDCVKAKRVEVKTTNLLFNPDVNDKTGGYSEILCVEDVIYSIERGSIEVSVQHTYPSSSSTITTYYGMQSSFRSEMSIMTPNGPYSSFTKESEVRPFIKNKYPDFRCYIEQNEANRFQSSFLFPEGLGDHSFLSYDNRVFTRATGKCYHWLVQNMSIGNGLQYYWKGLYNWFTPYYEDETLFVYEAQAEGSPLLFINTKTTFQGYVPVPEELRGRDYQIVSKPASVYLGRQIESEGCYVRAESSVGIVLRVL